MESVAAVKVEAASKDHEGDEERERPAGRTRQRLLHRARLPHIETGKLALVP